MIIATYQGPVVLGDGEANLAAVLKTLEQAQDAGAEILCMPETFLHGYFRTAETARRNAVALDGKFFRHVLEETGRFEPTLILGLNELRGEKLFNTVAVMQQGKLLGRYSKNYLVFRYFEHGGEFPVFQRRDIQFGAVICADTSYVEPARILAMRGAQIIFTPHFNYIGYDNLDDHTHRVRQHHVAIAIDNDVYVARSNVVVPESQGSDHFGYAGVGVGDSVILNRRGRVLAEAGIGKTTLLTCELDEEDLRNPRRRPWQRVTPTLADTLHAEYQKVFATHANLGEEDESQQPRDA